MEGIYELQKQFCERNNLPLFASEKCFHDYEWVDESRKITTFDEMMKEKYDDARLAASSMHIISCPICCKSWCD